MQTENGKAQRYVRRVLEGELVANGLIVCLVSGQSPALEGDATGGRRRCPLGELLLQNRLSLAVVADPDQNRFRIARDLHALLGTRGAYDSAAATAVVASIEHREYHGFAAAALSCLRNDYYFR